VVRKGIPLIAIVFVLAATCIVTAAPIPESWSRNMNAAELGITKFNQAPELDEKVKRGELSPVEERLPHPEDILVIEPVEGIGKYGGEAVSNAVGPNTWSDSDHARLPFLFFTDQNASVVLGDVAKDYKLENNNRELTIYLRRGMKWSDGHPFTVDDILFWWEDQVNDPEINHWAQSFWIVDGQKPDFIRVDDYTLRIVFPSPNPTMLGVINYWPTQQSHCFDPAHYMKQFHKKYNPDVVRIAKEKGFETWVQYFDYMKNVGPGQQNPDVPVVGPWKLEEYSTVRKVYVRNPYYYAVDTEGNQLPYLDRWVSEIVSDVQVAKLNVLQGDIDFGGRILTSTEFPMYKMNEEAGNYRVLNWKSNLAATEAFSFNQNHPDEVKRQIFQDVRFRRAMSVAINREEINEFAYLGLATPTQVTIDPGASYFESSWAEAYADYDPELAEQLLDGMGLKKGPDGFRLRPDGQVLVIDFQYPNPDDVGMSGLSQVVELVKQYWEEVGVKVNLRAIADELFVSRVASGDADVGVCRVDRMVELRAFIPGMTRFSFDDEFMGFAVEWAQWHEWNLWDRAGRRGDEPPKGIRPPEDVIEYMENVEQWYKSPNDDEYMRLAKEIWGFYADKLYVVGTVARPLLPVIVSNDLRNVPSEAPFTDDTSWWKVAHPHQWYKAE
jgi:peptide/nickel transport system substrate-binding protein